MYVPNPLVENLLIPGASYCYFVAHTRLFTDSGSPIIGTNTRYNTQWLCWYGVDRNSRTLVEFGLHYSGAIGVGFSVGGRSTFLHRSRPIGIDLMFPMYCACTV